MIKLKINMRKDGQQVARFRDTKGRLVRTSAGQVNWVQARQLMQLALYGIKLQREQAADGLGSDGLPMPPLKSGPRRFIQRVNGQAQFAKKLRNLYGPGKDGHMLDDIRVNYVDDKRVQFAITRRPSRIKALANEQRYPWYGWSPASVRKLTARAAEIFGTGVAEYIVSLGLASANAVASSGRFLRRIS